MKVVAKCENKAERDVRGERKAAHDPPCLAHGLARNDDTCQSFLEDSLKIYISSFLFIYNPSKTTNRWMKDIFIFLVSIVALDGWCKEEIKI